jgi:cytochrome c2
VVIRKIIQIAIGSASDSGYSNEVFALCDDGTVWTDSQVGKWIKLPNIPQNETE